MAYPVNITARASRDLFRIYEEIEAAESGTALKWYLGLKKAIESLEQMPMRCPVIRENRRLRHLLYGHKPYVYRIIFRVRERPKRVDVIHIRHGAREDLS